MADPNQASCKRQGMSNSPQTPSDDDMRQSAHMQVFRLSRTDAVEYPPRIPVAMRIPFIVGSVKQFPAEAQHQQLQQHIVSESFIPVTPDLVKPPRRRRRPPFSYSLLIAQAILESENERMTLRDLYKWIMNKYPALCDANDTGWQNTIRHNLSLNKYFKKIPKSSANGTDVAGKGGYWTVDPAYVQKFKQSELAKKAVTSASSSRQRKPAKTPAAPDETHSDDNRRKSCTCQPSSQFIRHVTHNTNTQPCGPFCSNQPSSSGTSTWTPDASHGPNEDIDMPDRSDDDHLLKANNPRTAPSSSSSSSSSFPSSNSYNNPRSLPSYTAHTASTPHTIHTTHSSHTAHAVPSYDRHSPLPPPITTASHMMQIHNLLN